MAIHFFTEDITFTLKNRRIIKNSIKELINNEGKRMGCINYIFVSENKILEINNLYLGHDYITDIITFDYCEEDQVSGDLFISPECITSNALQYGVPFQEELMRVMAHGVLHLLGYKDKKPEEQKVMRNKEDGFLALFQSKITKAPNK